MRKLRIELNRAGVKELLQSEEMAQVLDDYAAQVASRAGAGYGHDASRAGKTRAHGRVWAESSEAVRDNEENNTLLRALG